MHRWLILSALALVVGCAETPAGRSQLILVPENIMDEMGGEAFSRMKSSRPLASDARTNEFVSCVSRHLIEATRRRYPELPMPERWEVVVFEDASANAFALPGGRIGVHTGLLDVAETDDQLAAVIGHEIAHVLASHGNERLTQQLGINAVLLLVGLFTDVESELLLQALGIGAHLGVTLPFSRAHESEADLMGLEIMASAGFRPEESAELWRNMAKAASGQPPEFLSTHPGHDTRIEELERHIPKARDHYRDGAPADCG